MIKQRLGGIIKTIARHISSKLHNCGPNRLNDLCFIKGVCLEYARAAKLTLGKSTMKDLHQIIKESEKVICL
jgi:S-adenosylmethionine/arginine decarboxylase-like enzyme